MLRAVAINRLTILAATLSINFGESSGRSLLRFCKSPLPLRKNLREDEEGNGLNDRNVLKGAQRHQRYDYCETSLGEKKPEGRVTERGAIADMAPYLLPIYRIGP